MRWRYFIFGSRMEWKSHPSNISAKIDSSWVRWFVRRKNQMWKENKHRWWQTQSDIKSSHSPLGHLSYRNLHLIHSSEECPMIIPENVQQNVMTHKIVFWHIITLLHNSTIHLQKNCLIMTYSYSHFAHKIW